MTSLRRYSNNCTRNGVPGGVDYINHKGAVRRVLSFAGNDADILFDETELISRLGKKARLNAYKNMAPFLFGGAYSRLQAVYSIRVDGFLPRRRGGREKRI